MNETCPTCGSAVRIVGSREGTQYYELEQPPPATAAVLRPKVQTFAECMEQKLRENDYKGGWNHMRPSDLYRRLREELGELWREIKVLEGMLPHNANDLALDQQRKIVREAADVANFAMMIADVCDALPSKAIATSTNVP